MTVVTDGSITSGTVTGSSNATLANVVVDSGANALLVAVHVPSGGFNTDITAMSWGGVNFSRVASLSDSNANSIDAWLGTGLTPSTSSLTFASGHGFAFHLAAISLAGVNTTTPTNAPSTVASSSNLNNAAVATTNGGYVFGCGIAESSSTFTAQNGQTQLVDNLFGGTVRLHAGKQTAAGASTQDRYTVAAFGALASFQINAAGAAVPLTFYANNPVQGGSNAGLLSLTAPVASTSTTGWTVGTSVPNRYSRQTYNNKVLATNFNATVQPSGSPVNSGEDCWRTSVATTGVFSAGTWYSSLSVIAVTSASSQRGAALFRIWRSVNADGTAATELTASRMTGGTLASNLLTTAAQSSSASTFISAVTLNNEYLFWQVAWSSTTTATSASADVVVRIGSMAQTSGSGLMTSVFSTFQSGGGGGSTPSGQYYYSLMADWFNR